MDARDLRRRGAEPADTALADTVAALRDEIRGLRSAARLRAVIEQAKGVLVERHHITLDEAFDRLRKMSQEHNVRLVEVAATVVGGRRPGRRGRPPDRPARRRPAQPHPPVAVGLAELARAAAAG